MIPRAYGTITNRSVVAVGAWNPLFPHHFELFAQLHERAISLGCSSLLVLLDPDPVTLLNGAAHWPMYNDSRATLDLILASGIDGVLRIKFRRRDLQASFGDLLDVVLQHTRIVELWLGATQTLGRDDKGSVDTVAALAHQHAIELRRFRHPPSQCLHFGLRQLLASGCLKPVIATVTRPPIWCRPRSAEARLSWIAGVYRAVALETVGQIAGTNDIEVTLIRGSRGASIFSWPNSHIRYLAFIAGPADVDCSAV